MNREASRRIFEFLAGSVRHTVPSNLRNRAEARSHNVVPADDEGSGVVLAPGLLLYFSAHITALLVSFGIDNDFL